MHLAERDTPKDVNPNKVKYEKIDSSENKENADKPEKTTEVEETSENTVSTVEKNSVEESYEMDARFISELMCTSGWFQIFLPLSQLKTCCQPN